MIIIEKPYVSEFLIDSIVQNDWTVLDNDALKIADIEEGALDIADTEEAKNYFANIRYPLIYSNSENSINWVIENLPESNTAKYIKLFKDKIKFREMLKDIYPDFYYREVEYSSLKKFALDELKFPLVIKPAVGFLSLGVHTVCNDNEWRQTLYALEDEMKEASLFYPDAVVNSSKFIIEEFIEGEEYAVDAYYDGGGLPVILNIFHHPFLNSKDVRDRIYTVSTDNMLKYMSHFTLLLKQIGDKNDIRNFPIHIEVRIKSDGTIVPIEVNPMRFAGWCTTDVAKYAWGINVYECFLNQKKPDWNEILSKSENKIYYFSMAEVPAGVDRKKIKSFDYDKYLSHFSNVLELRRINPHNHPLFAVIFGSTEDKEEISRILELRTNDFTVF